MTNQIQDNNGFIEIKNNPIATAGIFDYYGSEIGASNSDRIYQVLISEDELSNEQTIDSFRGMPFTDDHVMLGDGAMPVDKRPIDGVLGDNVYFDNGTLYANIRLYTDKIKELIKKGKRELSTAYYSTYIFEPGIWHGKSYDAKQVGIKGNHIALVDAGRMGSEIMVLNNKSKLIFTANNEAKNMDDEEMQEEVAEATTLADVMRELEAIHKALGVKDENMCAKNEEAKDEDENKEPVENEDMTEKNKDDEATMNARAAKQITESQTVIKLATDAIGVFNSAGLTNEQIAVQACKKLGIKLEVYQDSPVTALKTYASMNAKLKREPVPLIPGTTASPKTKDEVLSYV